MVRVPPVVFLPLKSARAATATNGRIAKRVSRDTRVQLFKSLIDRMSLSISRNNGAVSEREVLQSAIVQDRNVSRLFRAYLALPLR